MLFVVQPGLTADINDAKAITDNLDQLAPEQILEVLYAAQDAAMIDSKVLKNVLVKHPGLTRALFEAQLNSDLVKVGFRGYLGNFFIQNSTVILVDKDSLTSSSGI